MRRNRKPPVSRSPEPQQPVNVRAVLCTGEEIPCECRYEGFINELHTWLVRVPVTIPAEISEVVMDVLPPRTQVVVQVRF